MTDSALTTLSLPSLWTLANRLLRDIEAAETLANATMDPALRRQRVAHADQLDKEHAKLTAEIRRREAR